MDTDSESIPTSEEEKEEVVEEVDYAVEVQKRLEEERAWQRGGGVKEEAPEVKVKKDPFAMLPKRYQSVGDITRERTSVEDKDTVPVEVTAAEEAAIPDPQPVTQEPAELELPVPLTRNQPTDPSYDPLEDFNPSFLVNLLDKDNEGLVFTPNTEDDHKFDLAQSVLEDMIESDVRFWDMQDSFKDKYCNIFEDVEENKLQYTDVHNEWVEVMDAYITKRLQHTIKNFSIEDFMGILEERADEVSGEVWALLLSFTDFQTFKRTMLEHKLGMDEETDHVLSQRDYNKLIDDAQTIMDEHFVAANKQRDAVLAKAAVESGMDKAFDNA